MVKERLSIAKDRDKHILARNNACQTYLIFKNEFEPIQGPHGVVDTSKESPPIGRGFVFGTP